MATMKETLEDGVNIDVECLIQRLPWDDGVQVLLMAGPRWPGDKRYVATNITFEEFDENNPNAREPTFKLRFDGPQKLMDALWGTGIRPSSGAGSVGQLAATEKHLGDMRAIVQKYTDAKLP